MRITPGRLPIAYQEVEWIGCDNGTSAYIDTNFLTNSGMKVELDAIALGQNDMFLGTMPINASENSNFTIARINNTQGYICWNNAHYYGTYSDWSTRRKATIYQSDSYIHQVIEGVDTTFSVVSPTYATPSKIFLFRRNDVGSPGNFATSKIRIYSCKFWLDDVLVRDFVPCYRISDSVIGMYDLVNDVFYTNAGSGTFTKGKDVGVVTAWSIDVNGVSKSVKKVVDGSNNVLWQRLPMQYAEVEWIGGSGTQYIDLGTPVPRYCRIETEFTIESGAHDKYMVAAIPWGSGSSNRFAMGVYDYVNPLGIFTAGYGQYSTSATYLSPQTVYDNDFHPWVFDYNDQKFEITDLELELDVTNISCSYPTNNIRLFYGINEATAGKMKYYKQWNSNVLVHDLVPCYRISDSVIGMYDLVTGTFFTNAGSGTFTKGNDV